MAFESYGTTGPMLCGILITYVKSIPTSHALPAFLWLGNTASNPAVITYPLQ